MDKKDIDEIQKQLEQLNDRRLVVAFAARMALHATLALVKEPEEPFLWFWIRKKETHLISLFRAIGLGSGISYSSNAAYAAANTAANTAAARATADADARTANDTKKFRGWILDQLQTLKQFNSPTKYLEDFPHLLSRQEKEEADRLVAEVRNLGNGFDLWADWLEARFKGEPINPDFDKAILETPPENWDESPERINAYLKQSLYGEDLQPLNKVRAIFIGYGESGKTSLIRVLHGEKIEEGEEDMTPGIEIKEWPVPGTEVRAIFWDFGGQVMAHATHQFFLRSNCVYVLLLNARADINANQQAEYWLEHV